MALAGLALFVSACTPGKVIIKPTEPIKAYNKLNVVVSSQTFLATIKGNKHYDNYVALTSEAERQIGGHIRNWAATEWKGSSNPRSRPLTVTLDLQDYNTGSGALKFFVGSAANGKLVYLVTLTDGSRTVGQFLFNGEVDITGNNAAFWNMSKQIEKRIAATE